MKSSLSYASAPPDSANCRQLTAVRQIPGYRRYLGGFGIQFVLQIDDFHFQFTVNLFAHDLIYRSIYYCASLFKWRLLWFPQKFNFNSYF